MRELSIVDATAQADLVRRGEVKPRELLDATLEAIDRLNPELNAVILRMDDEARRTLDAGLPDGPFTGVPYLLKDLAVEYAGTRFTEGSRFLQDNVSAHDQEMTVRLKRAGLVICGKTNTPEFGMVPTCQPELFGVTRNPWAPDRTTAGSSGGSAAAVAAGILPMAYANDLGGSIRFPASCCGLFGLKPTRARNPLGPEYGDVMSGYATEHAVTRSVRDSAALLDATSGPDVGDPYWAPPPKRPFIEEVGTDPGRLRVAFSVSPPNGAEAHPDCVAAVRDAAALCESLGHEVVEADPPGLDDPDLAQARMTIYGSATPWIVGYWARKLGREPAPDDLEPLTRVLLDFGRSVTAGDYLLAVELVQRKSRDVARFLTDHDVWLTPTLGEPPPPISELAISEESPFEDFLRTESFTAFPAWLANATGNPAMSVPLHWSAEGLPIGVQFLGRFGDEATLLRLAAQLEEARPWADRRPPVHVLAESDASA